MENLVESFDDRVLAFVDVLGWKNLIEESIRHPGTFQLILAAASTIRLPSLVAGVDADNDDDRDVHAAHFSDTFVLSAPPEQGAVTILLSYVRSLCTVLLKAGHYTRGAIVRGQLFHRHDVIFGPALVEAYEIEKSVARNPRIVVTSQARATIESDQDTLVSRDSDGQYFLDFLCALERPDDLPRIRERVQEKMDRETGRAELKEKNDWMLAYIDRVLNGG